MAQTNSIGTTVLQKLTAAQDTALTFVILCSEPCEFSPHPPTPIFRIHISIILLPMHRSGKHSLPFWIRNFRSKLWLGDGTQEFLFDLHDL
jgi:hypothetical protein